MPGLLISFEGPEGGGKSTQIELLGERLRSQGLDPLLTREPGGTPAGEAIRAVVLDPGLQVAPLTEFLLYSASRAQHVNDILAPALSAQRVVVTDRFAAASVAYQGYGRGLDLAFVAELNRVATGGIRPDLTVLLDLEPRLGLGRISRRGESDRLEQADIDFHQRVRGGFLRQAEEAGDWLVLDATRPAKELSDTIWDRVAGLISVMTPETGGLP